MNTLNYIGSKHTLSPILIDIINNEVPDLNTKHFLDLFAGTGSVGFRFQDLTNKCSANDLEYYSYIINNALIKCCYSSKLQNILDTCNNLEGVNGLIYQNYSENEHCSRMFFTPDNAQKCDAIRIYIEELHTNQEINQNEYYYLLASLIVSMDKVANTSCVYGAYLKEYKRSALKPLIVIPIHMKTDVKIDSNFVYNMSAETLSTTDKFYDIVYMDPPYNQRQYSANYCPLNYIAYYDTNIKLNGKTGTINGYNKSKFCSKPNVKQSFKITLDNLKCDYIFISYNNEGLLSYDELANLLIGYGEVKLYKIPYKKFKAQKNVSGDTVYEFLWVINKKNILRDFIEDIEYIID
jgi:adenine-specific DNA-methyltransferase